MTCRCRETFSHTIPDNPANPLQTSKPERYAGRTYPTPQRRQQDERFRLWTPVPDRHRMTYWASVGTPTSGSKRKYRMERSGSTCPGGGTAYPPTEISASTGCRRSDIYRRHATRHLTAHPLGSVNRARWPAEVASRNARMQAPCSRI